MSMFIVATSLDKPDRDTLRKIRSHAMRGRNTRADRLARAQARLVSHTGREVAPKKTARICHPSPQDNPIPTDERDESIPNHHDAGWPHQLNIPRKLASELSLERYDFEMKPYMLELIHEAFAISKPCKYAVDMMLIHESESQIFSLSDLHTHELSIHSILFTALAFKELSTGSESSLLTRYHLGETLRCIQESFESEQTATSMATIGAIVNLASVASSLGDADTTVKHMDGLYRIFELRGGISAPEAGTMVELKVQRVEICLSMAVGRKPRLLPEAQLWDQLAPVPTPHSDTDLWCSRPMFLTTDVRLRTVWIDLHRYSRIANYSAASGTSVPPHLFLTVSTTLPNILLNLSYAPNSTSELLRLCMLAYIKSILFSLPGVGKQMVHLSDSLEIALQSFMQQEPYTPDRLITSLWALYITGTYILEDFTRRWYQESLIQVLLALGVDSWMQCRALLETVLWINIVHDSPVNTGFKQAFSGL